MIHRWLVAIACVVTLASLGTAQTAFAQTTGVLEGTVLDESASPLPGVPINLKSPSLIGTRTTITDTGGRFRFPALPPGTYALAATLSGFAPLEKRDLAVRLGYTTSVPLVLGVSVKQEIVVSGEAPVVDVKSTTAGTNYTEKVISSLPLGRNYADVVRLQPGVQTDNGETQGRSLALSIYGSTSAENLFLVDGVNTTNVIKGFQGKTVNSEFVQEVEVMTGGYQAEFGRNTGGVVNVITKQGGNEFHGGAFAYYDDVGMQAAPRIELYPDYAQAGDNELSVRYPKNTRWDMGASLGGYFVKDYLWFFGAYNRVSTDRISSPLTGPTAGKEFPEGFTSDYYSGKLTWRASPSTEVSASLIADPQTNDGSITTDAPTDPDPLTWDGVQKLGGQDYALRANQLLSSWGLLAAQYSRHTDKYRRYVPDVMRVVDRTDNILNGGAVIVSGGPGNVFGPTVNNESARDGVKGTFSIFLGAHEVKAGGDWQKDATTGSTYFPGGQQVQIYPCQDVSNYRCDPAKAPVVQTAAGRIPVFYLHRYYAPSGSDLSPLATSPFDVPNELWSAFVQDEWKVMPNLTVNVGIRYDDQKVFKGDGRLAFDLKNQWSPRVGFAWDFLKNGSSKLYGSWGRFHYATPTDLNVRVFTANTSVSVYNYSSGGTDQDPTAPRGRLIQVGSVDGEPVDPGLKASYQDEWTLGIEKAFGPTLSVGAKYTERTLGRTIEDRCDLDASDPANGFSSCAIFNPGGDGPAASGHIATCNGTGNPYDPTAGECSFPGVAVPDARRKFRGFELVARKRIGASFWAQASYLYSKLEGNYSGAIRTESGQTDPGINADFDYYQFLENAYGKLELDRTHQFRLDTAYTFPFGLQAALGLWLRSGTPYGVSGWFNDFYPTELNLVPRGSAGRTPAQWDADLSLAYSFHVGPATITPQLLVYNAFNNQIVTGYNTNFNPNGSFVGNPASPWYGQPGVEPGTGHCPAGGRPCTDNIDFMKNGGRTAARAVRVAMRVAF